MKNRLFIILAVGLSLFLTRSLAYSQNFATQNNNNSANTQETGKHTEKKEVELIEDELSDQDLNNLLSTQGVPVYSNTDVLIGSESKYTLGPEDVIKIEVPRHPEVTGEYVINSEGKIQYGFVGDVEVAGLTKKEVGEYLEEKLSKYIISPEVLVTIVGYNSKVVYVIGEVGAPGKIYMRGDTITIREALVQAALPQLSAKAAKSWLITPSDDGKPKKRRVNVYRLLYEGDLRENFVMKPGDTLYLPPTFLTKTMRAISPVTEPVNDSVGTSRNVATPYPR